MATAAKYKIYNGTTWIELVSTENLKTINGQSLIGSGDITITGGGSLPTDPEFNSVRVRDVSNNTGIGSVSIHEDEIEYETRNGEVFYIQYPQKSGTLATLDGNGNLVFNNYNEGVRFTIYNDKDGLFYDDNEDKLTLYSQYGIMLTSEVRPVWNNGEEYKELATLDDIQSGSLPTDPTFNSISLVSSDGNYTSTLTRKSRIYAELDSGLSVQGHGYFYGNFFITGDLTLKNYNKRILNSDGKTLLKSVNSARFEIGNTSLTLGIYGVSDYLYYNDSPLAFSDEVIEVVNNLESVNNTITELNNTTSTTKAKTELIEENLEKILPNTKGKVVGETLVLINADVDGETANLTGSDVTDETLSFVENEYSGSSKKLVASGDLVQSLTSLPNIIKPDKTYLILLQEKDSYEARTGIIKTAKEDAQGGRWAGETIMRYRNSNNEHFIISVSVSELGLYVGAPFNNISLTFDVDTIYEIYELPF